MIRKEGIILWPAYFDSKNSRKHGRRVSLSMAFQRPSVDDLMIVCRKLGFDVEKVDASYPRTWFRKSGYVVVKTGRKLSKNLLVKMVAEELRKIGK
ncbi:MAG: signal recognition particle subunit SRP19/SEC65 family protein [Candidatus Caldarchaeum sp.]|nr:signal recognition particle subunit SRP19/SEC65 family protein [Candidatus Caldarchaeum sp.]